MLYYELTAILRRAASKLICQWLMRTIVCQMNVVNRSSTENVIPILINSEISETPENEISFLAKPQLMSGLAS